ncbi:hypothetical protein FJY90_04480 [Candidatus Gottesmanbacteria bacterium]|nr:hypothetical protein [Candidatus Gottesmanbacteria bacterium]
MAKNKDTGVSLIEVTIGVAVIALLISLVISGNFTSYLAKARDSKRKQDLGKFTRILDDYYNDYQQYPPANDPPDGNIAGSPWGSAFSPYASALPKDPLSPARDYYYQTGPLRKFYVIYTKLENTSDPDIERIGCLEGCGPRDQTGKRAYNYLVTSTDVKLLAGIPEGYDPGSESGPGEPTSPGGGGGGGGGEPSPTTGPSPTLGPSPTSSIPIPTVTAPPGSCDNNTCCAGRWCGDQQEGYQCGAFQKCYFNVSGPEGTWECTCSRMCWGFWCAE